MLEVSIKLVSEKKGKIPFKEAIVDNGYLTKSNGPIEVTDMMDKKIEITSQSF